MGTGPHELQADTSAALPIGRKCEVRSCEMRALSLSAAAFVLAAGAFWATMLTEPPQSKAAVQPSLNIQELTLKANPVASPPYDAF